MNQNPYEVMGLPSDASKDQIESRYLILVKKAKANSKRIWTQDGDHEREWAHQDVEFHRINQAYKQLMGYADTKPNRIMFRELPLSEKVSYIWEYYRYHIAGGMLLLGLMGYILFDQITKEPKPPGYGNPDVIISIMGEFGNIETEKLRQSLGALFPQWANIRIKSMHTRTQVRDEYDVAVQQKQFLTTAFETPPDLYLMDETQFNRYVNMELFMGLEGKTASPDKLLEKAVIRHIEGSKDPTSHTFGVNVTDSPLLQGIGLVGDVIAGIRTDARRPEHAEQLLDKLLEAGLD
jgi:hypothetical protein